MGPGYVPSLLNRPCIQGVKNDAGETSFGTEQTVIDE